MIASPPKRLRQIAVLVASVDSESARHLLLSLPSEIARNVRQMAAEMGPISPEERRAVMMELQKSRTGAWPNGEWSDGGWTAPAPERSAASVELEANSERRASPDAWDSSDLPKPPHTSDSATNPDVASPAWTKLSVDALVRFVRHERPTVIAVIIHQLSPQSAARVLEKLPASISRQVLIGLQNLQEIDPEAMSAIDEHLSQRLSEYCHRIESDIENTKKINLLLAAASPELSRQWAQWLKMEPHRTLDTIQTPAPRHDESFGQAEALTAKDPFSPQLEHYGESESSIDYRESHILPFRSPTQVSSGRTMHSVEMPEVTTEQRQRLHEEMEQILTLAPEQLARMLGLLDSQSILLALAGAQPRFIKQFNSLLEPKDARLLEMRVKRIGPVHLREIDEAQHKVVQTFRAFCDAETTARAA
jgi:flagellar motor switch protein FliG